MANLEHATYLDHIRSESARFRDVLADCNPAASVPACPDWTATDLLWHLGVVQSFWGRVVRGRPAGPDESWQSPERPDGRGELLAFFDDASAGFAAALAEADPADEAWSWAPEQTVGFTFRRQAHEALIHRLDAEQTAGLSPSPIDAALAADGVAELMEVMYGGTPPGWADFTPVGGEVALVLSDVGAEVRVQPGHLAGTSPEPGDDVTGPHVVVVPGPGEASATVAGTAADMDAWLWRRRDEVGITVTGDGASYDAFRAAVDQPID